MAITPEDGEKIIKDYNKHINMGHLPETAFEDSVISLLREGKSPQEIQQFFGMNSGKFQNFNKGLIGEIAKWANELHKPPLREVLEQGNSSLNKLKEILTIYYLRHLQQEEYREKGDYISYDRIKSGFDAEDYGYYNLQNLIIHHFLEYENIDLREETPPFHNYRKEIDGILYNVIERWDERSLDESQTIEKLKAYARRKGYLETFIESPDRLREMPPFYDESSGPGWGVKDQAGAVRFAPTPNGPLHIGHGRGISLLADYADKYDMEFYLRFDDTNQEDKTSNLPSEYQIDDVYRHIIEDVTWIIGRRPDKIIYASDKENLLRYEDEARELIKKEYAFVLFVTPDEEEPYKYGKSVDENLDMFDEMLDAGPNSDTFSRASVILGVAGGPKNTRKLYDRNSPNETQFEHIQRVREDVKNYITQVVNTGKIVDFEDKDGKPYKKLRGLNNARDGSKFMGTQGKENIRVINGEGGHNRGDEQWVWPNLSLQSVIDDWYYGVTHALRGTDYDLEVAKRNKDNDVLQTIYFQGILRMLMGAPPVYTASNWGNVSWDGQIWDYNTGPTPAVFLNRKTKSMSTSKIKAGIEDGKYDNGFKTEGLPTIWNIRKQKDQRLGSSFKFYWTRFDLPNEESPTFKRDEYYRLNEELKQAFPDIEGLKEKNEEVTARIERLQEGRKYLAEDYSSSE